MTDGGNWIGKSVESGGAGDQLISYWVSNDSSEGSRFHSISIPSVVRFLNLRANPRGDGVGVTVGVGVGVDVGVGVGVLVAVGSSVIADSMKAAL